MRKPYRRWAAVVLAMLLAGDLVYHHTLLGDWTDESGEVMVRVPLVGRGFWICERPNESIALPGLGGHFTLTTHGQQARRGGKARFYVAYYDGWMDGTTLVMHRHLQYPSFVPSENNPDSTVWQGRLPDTTVRSADDPYVDTYTLTRRSLLRESNGTLSPQYYCGILP